MNRSLLIPAVTLFFCIVLSSCGNDDPAPESTIFELEAEGAFPGSLSAVIITNSGGEVVAYADVKDGNQLVLEANPEEAGDKITVTLVEYFTASAGAKDRASINSYTGITPGSKWMLRKQNSGNDKPNEVVELEIANLPGDKPGFPQVSVSSIGSFIDRISTSGETHPLIYNVELDQPVSDLFVNATGYGEPRYLLLDLTSGTSHSLDFAEDFAVLDELITLSDPHENFFVSLGGHNEASPDFWFKRHVMSEFYGTNTGGLKVGYNVDYTFYSTYWSVDTEDGQYIHTKFGDPPTAATFTMEEIDFTIRSTGFNMFNFETLDNYNYVTCQWLLNNVNNPDEPKVEWNAYFPDATETVIMNNLPWELQDKHPGLFGVREKVSLEYAALVIGKGGFNYDDFISITFEEPTFDQAHEYVTVRKFHH